MTSSGNPGGACLSARAELARLDAHFIAVLHSLETEPPHSLSPVQRRARALHVERLERYRRRGRFPKNRRFPGRHVPHFIDDAGTRCALGQLIELSGGRDLVQWIARERNYALVRELRGVPELSAWLVANGLTLAEAARIQPRYCGSPASNCVCGRDRVEGTLGDGGASLTVTAIYGSVPGVAVGDVLSVSLQDGVSATSDLFFATPTPISDFAVIEFGAENGQVTVPESACAFSQVAMIPGLVPLPTFRRALAESAVDCEGVLTAYDPRWGAEYCDDVVSGGGGSGGTGFGGSATGGSGGSTSTGGTEGGVAGDAGVPTSHAADDGGCSMATHDPGSPIAVMAFSAACVMYRMRRLGRTGSYAEHGQPSSS